MAFLRPEAAATLRRWREVIAALALVALGLWIAWRPGPIVQGFGWVLALGGLLMLLPAIRRARVRATGQGPGIVRVDEARILYLGPVTGGAIALSEMTALSLRRDAGGQAAWVLTEPGQLLAIPVDALGAEALFDAFSALPGLAPQRLLAALDDDRPGTSQLWTRARAAPALTR